LRGRRRFFLLATAEQGGQDGGGNQRGENWIESHGSLGRERGKTLEQNASDKCG